MSQINTMSISNYNELHEHLERTKSSLKRNVKKTSFLRFIFRRIPLYSGVGAVFFALCLAITMIDHIGFVTVDKFLKQIVFFDVNWFALAFIFSVLLLVVSLFFYEWSCSESGFFAERQISLEGELALNWKYKMLTHFLLMIMLFTGFSVVITSNYPLVFGFIGFSVVTLSAMLVERTLGFTRRNERHLLFALRAQDLQMLFASRESLTVPFTESHLLELIKFHEELRQSKHNDTIADTHYLIAQLEQFKDASK